MKKKKKWFFISWRKRGEMGAEWGLKRGRFLGD